MVGVKEPGANGSRRSGDGPSVVIDLHIAYRAVLDSSHHNATSLNAIKARVTRIVMEGRVSNHNVRDKSAARFAVGANAASSEPADVNIVNGKSIDAVVRAAPESNGYPGVTTIGSVSHEDEVVDDDVHARRRVLRINGDRIRVGRNGGPGVGVQRSNPQRLRAGSVGIAQIEEKGSTKRAYWSAAISENASKRFKQCLPSI